MTAHHKLATTRGLTPPRIASRVTLPEVPRRRYLLPRLVGLIAGIVGVIVLPFVVLVRASVHLYAERDVSTWLAIGGAALAVVVVLTIYAAWISNRLTGRARATLLAKRIVIPIVVAYVAQALLSISSVNAKTADVERHYRSLHPILRIALSTVILVDRDIVVTDALRSSEDYGVMGLPAERASHHYRQADGYVHAVDLRTLGRPGWRNWAVHGYFSLMGFDTRRHVGTADHLHVELPFP